jgi:hypothetical protein
VILGCVVLFGWGFGMGLGELGLVHTDCAGMGWFWGAAEGFGGRSTVGLE